MGRKRIKLDDDLSKSLQALKVFFISKFQEFSEDEKRYVLQMGSTILGSIMLDAIDEAVSRLDKIQTDKDKEAPTEDKGGDQE